MLDIFEVGSDHELVVFGSDRETGLQAIIAIYSTALGPALGGVRFYPYRSTEDAIRDVLNLSKGMAYKNAMAGLSLGGGKAVIVGDPSMTKTEPLLESYGRFVESMRGRYVTACDVGTTVHDMDVVARSCSYVTGRSRSDGGAGDSSILTAVGVYRGMLACAEHMWTVRSIRNRRVGVAGAGKVGHLLVGLLIQKGASVVVCDIDPQAVDRIRRTYPAVEIVDDTDSLIRSDIDIYAPCALGGAINDETVKVIKSSIICGAANNQLASPGLEEELARRGILYAPDYVVNAGGVIQVADELSGFRFERAKHRTMRIYNTTREVLQFAEMNGINPSLAADQIAENRMVGVVDRRSVVAPFSMIG